MKFVTGAAIAFALVGLTVLLLGVPRGQGAHMSPTVVAIVTVGPAPVGVGVNPSTDRVYVANSGGFPGTTSQRRQCPPAYLRLEEQPFACWQALSFLAMISVAAVCLPI